MANDYETTYDGLPISKEKPYGTAIIVFRRTAMAHQYLVLHRRRIDTDFGDWAWGPPAGARLPGESVADCAVRELWEETGLTLAAELTTVGSQEFWIYYAEAPAEVTVVLSDEHDRFAWLPAVEAARLCQPAVVGNGILSVAQIVGDTPKESSTVA